MSKFDSTEYRVYGPPGCGKTTYIASRAARAVEVYGEDQVSICSLTNSAIREVVGRDLPIDPRNMATLHARCKRSLNAPGPAESRVAEFIEGYPEYATEECLPPALIRQRRKDDEPETTDEVLVSGSREPTLYERVQILRQQMIPESSWNQDLRSWYSAWRDFMEQIEAPDYTGWLETALREASLPAQQVVFVDEAQDHTPLQLAVIRSWPTRTRVLVGDDDQNLYEWSGAIPDRFFLPELPPERETVLSQSYRVPRAVHRIAQAHVQRIRNRRAKEYRPRDEEGAVHLGGYSLASVEMGRLPQAVEQNDGRTVMFLTSAGYMLNPLTDLLIERRIPFHNPYRRSNPRWNPLEKIGRILDAFLSPSWTGLSAHEWLSVLGTTGVFQRGRREELLKVLKAHPRDPFYLEDLAPYLEPEAIRLIDREDLRLFHRRRKGRTGHWDYAIDLYQRPRSEREPRLIVGTIHSVKGGEADVVYLMPDLSPAAVRDLYGHNRDRINRLMYVGMTRSAHTLVLGDSTNPFAVSW